MKHNFIHAIGLAFAISLTCGCGAKWGGEQNGSSVDGIATLKKSGPENFSEFLKRFKVDSVFQKSRVEFPLPHDVIEDIDDDRHETSKLEVENWHYVDMKYDSSYATRELDAYTERIVLKGNSAKVLYEGVSCGINVIFEFERIENRWMLKRWSDLST